MQYASVQQANCKSWPVSYCGAHTMCRFSSFPWFSFARFSFVYLHAFRKMSVRCISIRTKVRHIGVHSILGYAKFWQQNSFRTSHVWFGWKTNRPNFEISFEYFQLNCAGNQRFTFAMRDINTRQLSREIWRKCERRIVVIVAANNLTPKAHRRHIRKETRKTRRSEASK